MKLDLECLRNFSADLTRKAFGDKYKIEASNVIKFLLSEIEILQKEKRELMNLVSLDDLERLGIKED